jgi:hypothetical protein
VIIVGSSSSIVSRRYRSRKKLLEELFASRVGVSFLNFGYRALLTVLVIEMKLVSLLTTAYVLSTS